MTKYVLTYFDSRGRAEPVRLVFALAQVAYEDRSVKNEDWPKLKPDSPLGQLPFLTVDGRVIPQSMTIVRYLARQHGLEGKDEGERIAADFVTETAIDARIAFGQIRFSPAWQDEAAKAKFIKESAPQHFGRLEKIIGDGSWFVGDAPTYADAVVFETLERYLIAWPDALAAHVKLAAFMKRFETLPSIQAYFKVRKPPQT